MRESFSLRTFTLDTNCALAVDEGRTAVPAVMALANAHARGDADVAIVAIMASEKQRSGGYLTDFGEFRQRLGALGLGHLGLVLPMLYFDVCYFDQALWADEEAEALERRVHEALFPSVAFEFAECCASLGLDPCAARPADVPKWLNAKCDVQAMWSHLRAGRGVFVTSDGNFHKPGKKAKLIALGAGRVETPASAAALVGGAG